MLAHWREFVAQYHLIGREISIPAEFDLSGVGAEIEILSEEAAKVEQEELYPGIGVAADGFVPVGGCSLGTGDPYFINNKDGANGPLYRIYHEEVTDSTYNRERAIATVLRDYRNVLKYLKTEQNRFT